MRAGAALTAAGAIALLAAVVVLVVALAGGDDAPPRHRPPSRTHVVADPRLGVSLRVPRTWDRLPGRRALRVRSGDRRVAISVSTIASRPAAAAFADDVRRSVTASLHGARVLDRGRSRVAGRPAVLMAIRGRNAAGQGLEVLAMSVESRWRTYAVATFGSPRASQKVLLQARAAIASLAFGRPG